MYMIMTHSKHPLPEKGGLRQLTAIFFTAALLLLAGCQSRPTKQHVAPAKGMDYKILLDAYGKPQNQEYLAAYEQTRYFWKLSAVRLQQSKAHSRPTVSRSGAVTSGSSYQSPTVQRIYCDLSVSVDSQNKVVSWDASGAGCRQIIYSQI